MTLYILTLKMLGEDYSDKKLADTTTNLVDQDRF